MAITGYFALYYPRLWEDSLYRLRYFNMRRKQPGLIASLKKQRGKIIQVINDYKHRMKDMPLSQAANQ
jgi:hypothetical protein